jgi:hypothetical protein
MGIEDFNKDMNEEMKKVEGDPKILADNMLVMKMMMKLPGISRVIIDVAGPAIMFMMNQMSMKDFRSEMEGLTDRLIDNQKSAEQYLKDMYGINFKDI